jgi:uncharacterized membrane protein (DUF373 family)
MIPSETVGEVRVHYGQRSSGLDTLITKLQRLIVSTLMILLCLVVALSTADLGVLIAKEVWKPPRFLIEVPDLLEIFGYFLLVVIGVELLDTLKGYLNKSEMHARVVLEVGLIAAARKVITMEPSTMSALTMFGIAALILALGLALYLENKVRNHEAGHAEKAES